ncbi:LysE family translocator [Propionibacteriaceae bacterium G57]|uniref:LysE family translocator n=1 Tax=Aestuariimicrobium sp. G57 TaxID=3418485 RepID=UPI003DA728CD
MVLGHFTVVLVVAAGLAALLASSEVAWTLLTVGGAAYLAWLGISVLRHSSSAGVPAVDVPAPTSTTPLRDTFTKGLGISLLNPKVFLLIPALFPQFTSTSAAWPIWAQLITLGLLHVTNTAVVYLLVGWGAATVLTRRPAAAKVVTVLSGVVMIGLGAGLLIEAVAARA